MDPKTVVYKRTGETLEQVRERLQRFSESTRGRLAKLAENGYTEPEVPGGVYLGPVRASKKS